MTKNPQKRLAVLGLVCAAAAPIGGCSGEGMSSGPGGQTEAPVTTSTIQRVFVIAMENHDEGEIIGNSTDAPYINDTLLPQAAQASNFDDELPISIPSEPHYVWMEAGTNAFSDHTFTTDSNPSSSNSTSSTAHLSTQLTTAGATWLSYQEGLNSSTGACPIASSGFYAPKHDPFVFFKDVSGSTPSKTNATCAAHHKPLTALSADLTNDAVASYNFITPNLCNDMHGASGCPDSNTIRSGDTWLKNNLPALISYVNAHAGVVFITWDEGENTSTMPFIAVGPHVKAGFTSTVTYSHSSLVKSAERIFGLPILSKVSSANDFSDLFQTGFFP